MTSKAQSVKKESAGKDKVEQITDKLRMLVEVAKQEIKPRNQQTEVYQSIS